MIFYHKGTLAFSYDATALLCTLCVLRGGIVFDLGSCQFGFSPMIFYIWLALGRRTDPEFFRDKSILFIKVLRLGVDL
jgi:hypothetical protein